MSDRIHRALYARCRERLDREASPTACIIDSQSVKSAEKGGGYIDPKGYDANKKRHILADTEDLLIHAIVHTANVKDPVGNSEAALLRDSRDGGVRLSPTLFGLYPFLRQVFADGGCRGPSFEQGAAQSLTQMQVDIVKRSDAAQGFVVLPRRWVVERTFA